MNALMPNQTLWKSLSHSILKWFEKARHVSMSLCKATSTYITQDNTSLLNQATETFLDLWHWYIGVQQAWDGTGTTSICIILMLRGAISIKSLSMWIADLWQGPQSRSRPLTEGLRLWECPIQSINKQGKAYTAIMVAAHAQAEMADGIVEFRATMQVITNSGKRTATTCWTLWSGHVGVGKLEAWVQMYLHIKCMLSVHVLDWEWSNICQANTWQCPCTTIIAWCLP